MKYSQVTINYINRAQTAKSCENLLLLVLQFSKNQQQKIRCKVPREHKVLCLNFNKVI